MPSICHITTRAAWEAARAGTEFRTPEFEQYGFVHCSTPEQVLLVLNAFFRGRNDLLLLIVNPARLKAEIRWELPDSKSGRLPGIPPDAVFPHVYGPINLDAVVRTVDLEPTSTGSFILPRPG